MEKALSPEDQVVLDACERIELVMAEMYRYFASLHAEDPIVADLWRRTAMDEENHARQFVLAKKLKRGAIDGMKVDHRKAENTLSVVLSVLKGLRENPPALEDALRSSIRLEEHLLQFHMDCVALFCEESFRTMFHAVMTADNGHITRLKETYARLFPTKQ